MVKKSEKEIKQLIRIIHDLMKTNCHINVQRK